MKHPKEELRLTKTSPPEGMVETFEQLYRRALGEHPERHVELVYYCGVCGNAVRYHKSRGGWVHIYPRLIPYRDFLNEQKTHDIVIKDATVWLGKLKR
jgi:hypothetical protein